MKEMKKEMNISKKESLEEEIKNYTQLLKKIKEQRKR